jgi:calcium-binding protein CML
MNTETVNLTAANLDIPSDLQALLPEQRLAALTQSFTQLDADGDRKVSLEEFLRHVLAAEEVRLTKAFEALDSDRDGFIGLEEYIVATEPNLGILKRFREMDLDKNGLISLDEALQIAAKLYLPLSADEVRIMIKKVDKDGDGQVSYYEYLGAIAQIGFQ